MQRTISHLLKDESAATAIEYGLLIGVVAMTLVFSMPAISNEIFRLYHGIENTTDAAANRH
jgi:pilus assembly protein Flp/PilA